MSECEIVQSDSGIAESWGKVSEDFTNMDFYPLIVVKLVTRSLGILMIELSLSRSFEGVSSLDMLAILIPDLSYASVFRSICKF